MIQPNLKRRLRRCVVCCAWLLFIAQSVSAQPDHANVIAAQPDQLEIYLKNLKLDRLLIEHLENDIGTETDQPQRLQKAQRLTGLYADELLKTKLTPNAAQHLIEKTESLLKLYPDLQNPRLQLAVLQSRYVALENSFRRWWSSPANVPREKLLQQWQSLNEDLDQFYANSEARYQELIVAVQANPGDLKLSQQLTSIESLHSHTSFLIGWTSYFRGILEPTTAPTKRAAWFQTADEHFRNFLQIDPRKSLTEFDSKWFDFKSPWHVRAIVGLAMVHRGLNHGQQSETCFQLIQQHGDQQSSDLLAVWELQSRLYVDQLESIPALIEKVQKEATQSLAAQNNFWEVVLESSAQIQKTSPNISHRMTQLALTGLTRNRQAPAIQQFLQHSASAQNLSASFFEDDFFGNWTQGYLWFYQAANTDQNLPRGSEKLTQTLARITPANAPSPKSPLERSKFHLLRALARTDAQNSPQDVARCSFLLGKIHFQQRHFRDAVPLFQSGAASLAMADRDLAAESQWLAAQSLLEISRHDPRQSAASYTAIDNLIRLFPNSQFADRARFEKLKLDLAALPGDQAIDHLQRIDVNDRAYPFALDEIVRIRFRMWLQAFEANQPELKANTPQLLTDLIDAASTAQRVDLLSSQTKLKLTLLVVDALLRYQPVDQTALQHWRGIADERASQFTNPTSAGFREHVYYAMLADQKIGDSAGAQTNARWLIDHAGGTRWERSALIYLGQLLESQWRASPSDRETLIQTHKLFKRLAEVLGTSDEKLQQSKNAQVTVLKLAELEQQLGNFDAANQYFETYTRLFPNHQLALLGLAQTRMELKQFAAALPLWKRLSAANQAGSDLWYESKLQLIVCVSQTDPDSAAKIYRQTLRLSPELPGKWITPYAELKEQLSLP